MNRLMRRARHGDDGAVLLLVLIFVFVVGVVLTALLPYVQTGIKEAKVARDVRSTQNAVDGAVGGAIEQLRHNINLPSGPCVYNAPPYPDPLGGPPINVTVTCTAAPGGAPPASDVPPYAVVTTVGGITTSGNHTLNIDGGVYATQDVTTTGGSQTNYSVIGPVYSKNGSCDHVLSSIDVVHCPITGGDPDFPSIDYPSTLGETAADAATTISNLPADPPGKCVAGTGYVQFQPGYYSQIPTPGPSCSGLPTSRYWLAPCASPPCAGTAPGTYYLDFKDGNYDGYDNNDAMWNLNQGNIDVIGGSLKADWATQDPGHRCDASRAGVQLVLGGPSQISTGNGSAMELCAGPTSASSNQRIALYGLSHLDKFGFAAPTGPRTPQTDDIPATNQTSPDAAGDRQFTSPAGAKKIGDGQLASATWATNGATYGVDLSGYTLTAGQPAVPDGSSITAAKLHIRHLEAATNGSVTPTVQIHFTDGTTDTCQVPTVNGALNDSEINLMATNACDHKYLSNAPYRWRLLHDPATGKSATITYSVDGRHTGPANRVFAGAETLDGVQLKLTYVKPAVEAERCPQGVTSCYSYSNSNSDATDNTFFIGTVYTPDEPLNVVVHNNPETIFQRGVVASAMQIVVSASSKQTDSPFQLPHGDATDRTVLFTATLTGDARKRLQALVQYIDCSPAATCVSDPNNAANQLYPGREADILEWTNLH